MILLLVNLYVQLYSHSFLTCKLINILLDQVSCIMGNLFHTCTCSCTCSLARHPDFFTPGEVKTARETNVHVHGHVGMCYIQLFAAKGVVVCCDVIIFVLSNSFVCVCVCVWCRW